MRKHCKRRVRQARAPMLVVMQTIPDVSLTERLSAEAFAGGYAGTDHFDNLADCRDILTLAASDRGDRETLAVCELAFVALTSIKDHHARTGHFSASGDELQALRTLADVSEDFWKRQGGALFATHYDALKRARAMQRGIQA